MKSLFIFLLVCVAMGHAHAQWTSFAPGNTNGTVIDLKWYQGSLYAGGFFTEINGDNADYVARWDGSNWQNVAGGLTDGVHHLEVIDSTLYAVRYEFQVDSNWVYYLDDTLWKKLGSGFYLAGANAGNFYTPNIFDVRRYNGDLYTCGEFSQNGDSAMAGIARWDGNTWSRLGTGLSTPFFGQVINPHQMLVHNGMLYVCGNFTMAGGQLVNGVAAWDGSSWSALGSGFNSTVYALGVYNNELYAGGDFSMSGTTPLSAVAKWDGNNWVSPGFGFQYSTPQGYLFVHSIQELNNELYLYGGFDRVVPDGQSPLVAGSIVAFDGQNLKTLAGGADNDVESLTPYMGQLLIGGFFATVGNGVPASKLGLYDSLVVAVAPAALTEVRAFPNPAGDRLWLEGPTGQLVYALYDLQGRQLLSGVYDRGIDLAGLPAGPYLLKIESDMVRKTLKIAKE